MIIGFHRLDMPDIHVRPSESCSLTHFWAHFCQAIPFCTLEMMLICNFYISHFLFVSEDNELVRIILVKSGRDAANCWHSLLANEYSADPWTFNEMEKKLTLERFQKEVHLTE